MRKVTQQVTTAFLNGVAKSVGNTSTDGKRLLFHGNCIAERTENGLLVQTCGWNTPTTRERLNGLPGVRTNQAKGQLYLNGKAWDGSKTSI